MATIERDSDVLFHSSAIPSGQSGDLISITRERGGWETISFSVKRLLKSESWTGGTDGEEAAFVLLGGRVTVDWGAGAQTIGQRAEVFSGYPCTVYLPCDTKFAFRAEADCEIADCRVPSNAASLKPRLITPD